MIFILAEKPSVAASFASALGVSRKDGYYQNGEYTITNCIGHLLSLYDAQDYDPKYANWKLEDLPILPATFKHKPVPSTKRQLDIIKDLLQSRYDKYIIATDAGREGELIARLVLEHCGITDYSSVYRFWTSSALTKEVIIEQVSSIKHSSLYDDLYNSGRYRQLADWLVGINFSRFFSVKFNGRFTFGRVQTPVLAMIVARDSDIKNFVVSQFYRLSVQTQGNGSCFTSFFVTADGNKDFDDKAILDEALPSLSGTSKVSDVSKETKTVSPPRLLDLTELQKLANVKYGYSAQKTLELAQSLYEKHKCLSYPRTSSRYLSLVNYDVFTQCLKSLGINDMSVSATDKNIFNDEAMEKNKEDHHALLLLNKLPSSASPDEKKIYDLVFTNMSNIVKPAYVYEQIKVCHTSDKHTFVASGRNVLSLGWKEQQPAEDEDEEDELDTQGMPILAVGDTLTLKDPAITTHERKPPKAFTEAALLSSMKKYGLGTVATRDTIIEGLIKNEYCFRKGKQFVSSDKAVFFIDAIMKLDHVQLQKYLNVENTKNWEEMLENDSQLFFMGVKEFVVTTINGIRLKGFDNYVSSIGICPLCGCQILNGKYSFYCEAQKADNCTFSIGKTICEAPITEHDVKTLLSGKQTTLKSMKSKNGKEFKAYLKLDGDRNIIFEFLKTNNTAAGKRKS